MITGIIFILIITLINLKELQQEKNRGRLMAVFFGLMGISLILHVLIKSGKMPGNPITILMDWTRSFGLGEG